MLVFIAVLLVITLAREHSFARSLEVRTTLDLDEEQSQVVSPNGQSQVVLGDHMALRDGGQRYRRDDAEGMVHDCQYWDKSEQEDKDFDEAYDEGSGGQGAKAGVGAGASEGQVEEYEDEDGEDYNYPESTGEKGDAEGTGEGEGVEVGIGVGAGAGVGVGVGVGEGDGKGEGEGVGVGIGVGAGAGVGVGVGEGEGEGEGDGEGEIGGDVGGYTDNGEYPEDDGKDTVKAGNDASNPVKGNDTTQAMPKPRSSAGNNISQVLHLLACILALCFSSKING